MLLLATGARRGEVAGMSWSELDLDANLWTIPASRRKSGQVHIVPLSATALKIINQLPRFASGDFLFPAYPRRQASSPAATRAWASRPIGGFGSVKARTDALIKAAGHEMQPWRLHDLRRTCRTNLSRLRVSNDVAEAVIGHVVPGVMGVYDRYDRLPEKAVALEAWANLLREILDPSPKVVALRR